MNPTPKLKLFNFFHLNLAYSAIEEAQRRQVIDRCYWPLLRLAEKQQLPIGIEVSGYTLESIAAIDHAWISALKDLLQKDLCQLIGCGYAQIIGPLVPAEVNAANLRLGMDAYESLLGVRPLLALLNEQAYASGLVGLYREAGYAGLVMEWNNPASGHPEWDPELRYLPQYACGPEGAALPLIWNKSIAFQKFQRYVHGEIELDEFLAYVLSHLGAGIRAFPVYGNDAEVFDFRPGRYMTEDPLHAEGEWIRIERLFEALKADERVELIPILGVLDLMDEKGAGQHLSLESAQGPVPVKKQEKYNLLRWAVTGRDDYRINSLCKSAYLRLRMDAGVADADWRELCYLWSSDFRTHITETRWAAYLARLDSFARRWCPEALASNPGLGIPDIKKAPGNASPQMPLGFERQGHILEIRGERLLVRLNCYRGLSLESFTDRRHGELALCGTLPHGYFDDIRWAADFYSGHVVFQSPGRMKATDLRSVEPICERVKGGFLVRARIATVLGPIEKEWRIDEDSGHVELHYVLHWPEEVVGSLRLGHLTLIPSAFDQDSLEYRTNNGGRSVEAFPLRDADFDHGEAVSFLISARQAVGLTEGLFEFADGHRCLRVEIVPPSGSLVGLVTHRKVGSQRLTRLALSVREVDDTSRPSSVSPLAIGIRYSIH